MTSQKKDKFVCGKLNWTCSSPISVMGGLMWEYPDFTSEAGRVQLLKLMSGRADFMKFLMSTYVWLVSPDAVTAHWADMFLDDTGKFRDTVYRWLGGEG